MTFEASLATPGAGPRSGAEDRPAAVGGLPPEHPVGAADVEAGIARALAAGPGGDAGILGPSSVMWRTQRESLNFMGAGRALLLQIAHPWIAQGVAEHSATRSDPLGRFHRTFSNVYGMVYGTADQAAAKARIVHRIHARIAGTLPDTAGPYEAGSAYYANEAHSLIWVQATLWDTAMRLRPKALEPLGPADRERYYRETKRFAALFGIPEPLLPADWEAFAAYCERMYDSEVLTVSPSARTTARYVLGIEPGGPPVPAWYRAFTTHLLPGRLRDAFELRYTQEHRATAERVERWLARVYPRLPRHVRCVGPWWEADARVKGRPRPGIWTRQLNKAWIGRPYLGG